MGVQLKAWAPATGWAGLRREQHLQSSTRSRCGMRAVKTVLLATAARALLCQGCRRPGRQSGAPRAQPQRHPAKTAPRAALWPGTSLGIHLKLNLLALHHHLDRPKPFWSSKSVTRLMVPGSFSLDFMTAYFSHSKFLEARIRPPLPTSLFCPTRRLAI